MKLLVFGHNDWWTWRRQGFCTRAAALVRALARRDDVDRIAVVDAPGARGRSARPAESAARPVVEVEDKIVAVSPGLPLPLPASWHAGRRLNEKLAAPGLHRRVDEALGTGGATVLWVSDPQLVALARTCRHDAFVFDLIDDWREHWWVDRRAVDAGYRCVVEDADLVTAVSGEMLERLGIDERGHVLYNAVDEAMWRAVTPDPDAFAGLARPVIGYVGSLQERLDMDLVADAARRLPDASFVLAGSILYRSASARTDVSTADLWAWSGMSGSPPPNLTYAGRVAHDRVPHWLAACDATFVPHRRDRMTSSMDPLKIYEYLAAGCPVVSTVPAPNPRLAPLVRCVDDAAGCAEALRDEVANDDAGRRAARRAALASETWTARAATVAGLLADLVGGAPSGDGR